MLGRNIVDGDGDLFAIGLFITARLAGEAVVASTESIFKSGFAAAGESGGKSGFRRKMDMSEVAGAMETNVRGFERTSKRKRRGDPGDDSCLLCRRDEDGVGC